MKSNMLSKDIYFIYIRSFYQNFKECHADFYRKLFQIWEDFDQSQRSCDVVRFLETKNCVYLQSSSTIHIKNEYCTGEKMTITCANSEQNRRASFRSPQILKGNQTSGFWKISRRSRTHNWHNQLCKWKMTNLNCSQNPLSGVSLVLHW